MCHAIHANASHHTYVSSKHSLLSMHSYMTLSIPIYHITHLNASRDTCVLFHKISSKHSAICSLRAVYHISICSESRPYMWWVMSLYVVSHSSKYSMYNASITIHQSIQLSAPRTYVHICESFRKGHSSTPYTKYTYLLSLSPSSLSLSRSPSLSHPHFHTGSISGTGPARGFEYSSAPFVYAPASVCMCQSLKGRINMYVYIYMHMCMHICTYIYIYICTYIYTHTCIYIYVCVQTYA